MQPVIPPKRFDMFFPLTGGCSEGLDAFRFFFKFNFLFFWHGISLSVHHHVTQVCTAVDYDESTSRSTCTKRAEIFGSKLVRGAFSRCLAGSGIVRLPPVSPRAISTPHIVSRTGQRIRSSGPLSMAIKAVESYNADFELEEKVLVPS